MGRESPDSGLSVSVRGQTITIIHDVADLDWSSRSRSHVVVTGHSHKPGYRVEDEILFFNPGSAGPRRFKLPISVGELTVTAGRISPKLVTIAASERLQRGGAAHCGGKVTNDEGSLRALSARDRESPERPGGRRHRERGQDALPGGGWGDIPATECWSELWVIDDAQVDRALRLIRTSRETMPEAEAGPPWVCGRCGEENERQFDACWRCGSVRMV